MFHVSTYVCILILIIHWIIKIKSTKFYWVTLCLKNKISKLKNFLRWKKFPAGNSEFFPLSSWKFKMLEITNCQKELNKNVYFMYFYCSKLRPDLWFPVLLFLVLLFCRYCKSWFINDLDIHFTNTIRGHHHEEWQLGTRNPTFGSAL